MQKGILLIHLSIEHFFKILDDHPGASMYLLALESTFFDEMGPIMSGEAKHFIPLCKYHIVALFVNSGSFYLMLGFG